MSVKTALKSAAPTPKVAAQTTVGLITGLITWLLVTTYWKTGLPIQVAVALPGVVTFVLGFAGGWLKKEGINVPPFTADSSLVLRTGATTSMYDSTNPAAIPSTAPLVASYVDGFGGYTQAVALFGASKVLSISVGNNDADIADVESGAMTPSDLPGWIARQVARGVARPVVYCNESTWPSVKAAVGDLNVSYWIADPGGSGVIAGADAVQNVWEGSWDSSVVQSTFPFYNGPVTPVTPPASGYPLSEGDTGALVSTTQTNLNKWAKPIKLATPLVVDGNFGALTLAAVKLALTYFDYSAANVALGQVPQSLATHLAGAVPVTPPPPPPTPHYGAPRSLVATPETETTIEYTLSWTAPAAVAGVPAPTEYQVYVYDGVADEAHIIGPATTVTSTSTTVALKPGQHYIVHVLAAGDAKYIGADIFATLDVTPPLA
jgi:hypothetical protein